MNNINKKEKTTFPKEEQELIIIQVLKDFNDIGFYFKKSFKPFEVKFDYNKYISYFKAREVQGYIKLI